MKRVSEMMETNRKKIQHGALFPSNPPKKNPAAGVYPSSGCREASGFLSGDVAWFEAYGIESRFVGGDSEVHGTPFVGGVGSLRPSENVKIIHLFVMFIRRT